MGPEVTFALKAFADVDKFEFPICSLIGTSREKSRPKPAPGGESNRNWDPTELQAQVSMT